MKLSHSFFKTEKLQVLLDNILNQGYECIGPQVRDGAIVYEKLTSIEQLPYGVTDKQEPGKYTLKKTSHKRYFDWANGPQAIKPILFTPREKLWESNALPDGKISFKTEEPEIKPTAIFAARACDIAAMELQNQHFLQQEFIDPFYKARHDRLLIIAVNCSTPADTCFCHSTGDGPFVKNGADIILTELKNGFLICADSDEGEQLLKGLDLKYLTVEQRTEYESIEQNARNQKRKLPAFDIQSRLLKELDNENWHSIAAKCLSCGNCTSVCPTCFCHNEVDTPSLDGKTAEHFREWDSCFSQGHSYIHGITIRSETSQRYRQWLTHKFSTWHEQYGRSGCVGCGRCISWCPVGIDVTESLLSIVERRCE